MVSPLCLNLSCLLDFKNNLKVEFWEASPGANPTELIPAASPDPTWQGFVLSQEMLVVALTGWVWLRELTQVWEEQPDPHFLVPDQCWDQFHRD